MAKKDLIKRADGSYSPRGLWDNIRANAGSGKAPTKEMLAQEKKINKMANGGKMSSFKASNIQTYAEGGPIEDLMEKFYKKNSTANIYASPFYTNALVGNFKPGYIAGIETDSGLGKKAPGFYASAYAGRQYNPSIPFNTMLSPEEQAYQNSITDITIPNPEGGNTLNPAALLGAPNAQNIIAGGKIGWQGKVVKGGQELGGGAIFESAMPRLELGAEYAPSTGVGFHAEAGSVFPFGNPYRNGLVKAGRPSGIIEPYTGLTVNSTKGAKLGWGVRAEGEYRPKSFKDFPMSFYGKAALTGGFGNASKNAGNISNVVNQDPNYDPTQNNNISTNTTGAGPMDKTLGTMFRPHVSGELGVRFPLQQIETRNINMPDINMSPLTSFLGRADKGGEENLQMQGGDPNGDFGPRVNASPIDKRWNKSAEDIYVPSTRSGSNVEPIIYDPNNPEGLAGNNFKRGGAMNFKSPAAYKAWLAYGHATGEFERTPGNQAVSIGGKAHNVKHAMGGHMYSMGGRAFADGGQLTEFNEGGSHEMNPLGGIPQGFAQDGKLNLVEQGETKLNAADYIFSDQIKISKEAATLFELPKSAIGKTYADLSKKVNRPDSRRENDTIEQVAIQRDLENLMQAQEQQKDMEKQDAIAEMQAKYPDLQVVDQAAMQQMQAPQEGQMQDPAMMDEAMMQQQQQMAPPAGMPQEMDPAMMAQMQQQGMMSHGGKMYNMGGHMYGAGGGMMALRGIGSAAYGVGEGVLDTLTFGLTDNITDKGYEKLSQIGDVDERQAGRLDAARGFGNTAGAITGAAITGGATTKSAISEGVEGLASGVAALPSTGEQVDKVAQGVGQLGSMYGNMFGGAPQNMNVIPKGVLEGNQAATKLMNAPQNKFITTGMNVAGNFMAQGGYLGAPTNSMFTNQFAAGSFMDPEIDPILQRMGLEQALNDPTIIEAFMPPNGDIEAAKAAIIEYYSNLNASNVPSDNITDNEEGDDTDLLEVEKLAQADEAIISAAAANGLVKPDGMTDDEWASDLKRMLIKTDKKEVLGEMKASPLLAGVSALPAIYNIGRGMFGKVDQLDAKDYQSRAMISPYEMNVDPQLAATRSAYGTAMQAARNSAPGAGSYLATLGNMANMRQQAIRDVYAQKENFDKSQKLEADKFNAQVEQGNMAQDLAIQQYNAQAKAAKQNMLATGLTQASEIAQGLSSTDLQEKYLQMISPDYAGNFKYMSIPEQMAAAAAARKANKTQNS
jgi:hypothetical protein